MLLQALRNQFRITKDTPVEERDSIALYFENLRRLPENAKKAILGDMPFPRVQAPQPSEVSSSHHRISEALRRKFTEHNKDFIVVDEWNPSHGYHNKRKSREWNH
jgi:hypothetical protein